jgi:hypothetical protein
MTIQTENDGTRFEPLVTVELNDLGPGAKRAKPDAEAGLSKTRFSALQPLKTNQ